MANLCDSYYKIVGKIGEVTNLYNRLEKLQKSTGKNYVNISFEAISQEFNLNDKIDLRGTIHAMVMRDDGVLDICATTAWHENSEFWDKIMEQYKDLCFYYLAEERGCDYFYNSDTTGEYFPEMYCISEQCDDGEVYYANNNAQLFTKMQELLKVDTIESIEQLKELLDEYNDNHEDECIYFNRFINPE